MPSEKKIGKWVITDEEVGKGSMSRIYKAQSSVTGKDVICKKVGKAALVGSLRQDELQREIEILRRFRYRHVLQFYEVMQSKQSIYIIMEYSCGSLTERHARGGLQADLKWEIFTQLILALMHVHARGISHREVHPDNIQLTPFDEVKLSGFTNATRTSHPMHDLWGLGITLFYLENGRSPFDLGPPEELINRINRGLYQMTREMSKEGKDICAKLITADVARRVGLSLLVANKHLATDSARVEEAKGKKLTERKVEDVKEDVTVFDLGPSKGGGKSLKKVVINEEETVSYAEDELPELAPVTIRKLGDAFTAKAGGGVFAGHAANKKTVFQP